MIDYSKNLFKNICPSIEPPEGLYDLVINRIKLRQIRTARLRFGIFSCLALASFVFLAPAARYFANDFYSSGFYSYISIMLTDGGSVLTYWKEFSFVLADSFPIMEATAVFSAMFVPFVSIRNLSGDVRVAFLPKRLFA